MTNNPGTKAPAVLVTGSSGRIGTLLAPRLSRLGWRLRLLDRNVGNAETIIGDATDPATLDKALAADEHGPVEAVVHLAGISTEDTWPRIQNANIEGTFQLFEAARRAGVRRVVYASSIHAVGFAGYSSNLAASTPPQPDTLYGVSKVFGETLARYYVDRYDMQVACLRIGTCAENPPDRRALATWLSPDDCARLVDAALRAPALDFSVVWGISANSSEFFSQTEGEELGYSPLDNAEDYDAQLPDEPLLPSDKFLGGGFTTGGFGIDAILSPKLSTC